MTCTTFLSSWELNRPSSNGVINTLLAEVRQKTGKDWQVTEREAKVARPWWRRFGKVKTVKLFTLYRGIGGVEYQIVNFYRNHDWSINHENDAELVVSYLHGILTGIHFSKKW